MKSHFSLCYCCIHTEDVNRAEGHHTQIKSVCESEWDLRVEQIKGLNAPAEIPSELVTVNHLNSHTAADVLLYVFVTRGNNLWESTL